MRITLIKKTLLIALFLIGYNSIQAGNNSFQTDSKRIESLKLVTDTLIQFIEDIKSELEYLASDQHEALDEYFIKLKEGELLVSKIDSYKVFILSNFPKNIKAKELNELLPTDEKNQKQFYSWKDQNTGHIKKEKALAMLTVIQFWVNNTKDKIIERSK